MVSREKDLSSMVQGLIEMSPVPVEEIVELLDSAASQPKIGDIKVLEWLAGRKDMGDELLAAPALALLPAWGESGIKIVAEHALRGKHGFTALSVLAVVANGQSPRSQDVLFLRDFCCSYVVSEQLAMVATRYIRLVMLEASGDRFIMSGLVASISTLGILSSVEGGIENWFDITLGFLVDSKLVINESLLNQFETMLDLAPKREEELQQFLTENPVLLDPFVTELRTKQQFGDDLITDFVIRRTNDEYVLVEIENSTDKLFTKDGQLTSKVNKAISQVRDFQTWVADNIAYAQKKMPGIKWPDGLVVVGRDQCLSTKDRQRLQSENFSRKGLIRVITYDDLLNQGRVVYKNVLNRHPTLRSREQRCY